MAKPGPKTEAGKAVVRRNAVKHGVLKASPVIPGLEREEDWEAHRAGIRASLAPEGHLEDTLAERIALLLWRLQRVARYETESIVLAQERAEEVLVWERTLETKGVWGVNFERLDLVVPSVDHDPARLERILRAVPPIRLIRQVLGHCCSVPSQHLNTTPPGPELISLCPGCYWTTSGF